MSATAISQQRKTSAAFPIWTALLVVLILAGLGTWINQIIHGLVLTDMRNITSWGLYIVSFMFFVGLSAGGLIMSSAARVFNISTYKPVSKLATFLSFVCILTAALFIIPDLGRPERIWHMVVYPNMTSPLMWDVIIIVVYLVLSAVYLWLQIRAEHGKTSEATLRVVSFIALPTAILVHSITAWIFGLQISRPYWHTALLAPMFISAALASGLALLMVVVLILRWRKVLDVSMDMIRSMSTLEAVFIFIDLFFLFAEMLTEAYPAAPEGIGPVLLLVTQTGAPVFWAEVIIGNIAALVLLLNPNTRRSPLAVGIAGALAVLGVFLHRFNLVMAGFVLPLIQAPTVQTGPQSANVGTFLQGLESYFPYFPSLTEWGVAAGLVAFALLLFTLGVRYLPLFPHPQQKAA